MGHPFNHHLPEASLTAGYRLVEPPDGLLGDRCEEIDEIAIGIAEQDGAIPPGHGCWLLHPVADEGLEPLEFLVHIIDEELDDHGVVVRRTGGVVE